MTQPKLYVGMLLTAKKNWSGPHIRGVFSAGKVYAVTRVFSDSFRVQLSDVEEVNFGLADIGKVFEIQPQGMKIGLPDFVNEVHLVIPDGLTIDVDNSNLAEGIIKYKKVKPKRPMSMDDFDPIIHGYRITTYNLIESVGARNEDSYHNLWPSKEWAESIQAQCKLVRLRDAWNEGWKPDWTTMENKWCIDISSNDLIVELWRNSLQFLAFPSQEIANEFLATFRDLIETYFKPYKS